MPSDNANQSINWQIHRRLTFLLKATMLAGAVLLFWQERYQAVVETLGIIFITFLPVILGHRFRVKIPPEFECLAVVLIFASLFLGEVQGYYVRFWWWDVILHTGSGFLLGVLGFLLVYVINEKDEIELDMKPQFVSLFAFMFAMGMAAIWEIFEFAMDQIFGMNMQKTGIVDTMWDLIVDGVGALVISIMGWGYLRRKGNDSFLEKWIDDFIERNPRLFPNEENRS
jgi:uncharacterized membrane protein